MRNVLRFLPALSCLKKTGPFEVSFVTIATVKRRGERMIIPNAEPTISMALFNTR